MKQCALPSLISVDIRLAKDNKYKMKQEGNLSNSSVPINDKLKKQSVISVISC